MPEFHLEFWLLGFKWTVSEQTIIRLVLRVYPKVDDETLAALVNILAVISFYFSKK